MMNTDNIDNNTNNTNNTNNNTNNTNNNTNNIDNNNQIYFPINNLIKENNEISCKKNDLIKEGKKILDKNKFFDDLNTIMSDESFCYFYEKYFRTFNDTKVILLYMKLYETIKKEYYSIYQTDIDNNILVKIIRDLMMNEESRKTIFESFKDYTDENNLSQCITTLNIFNIKSNKIKY